MSSQSIPGLKAAPALKNRQRTYAYRNSFDGDACGGSAEESNSDDCGKIAAQFQTPDAQRRRRRVSRDGTVTPPSGKHPSRASPERQASARQLDFDNLSTTSRSPAAIIEAVLGDDPEVVEEFAVMDEDAACGLFCRRRIASRE
eukprot:CAMPEP_0195520628 /NCGR_PEP_ID=MMETSP0794_2-20130614/17312_1 /TAXON_ID=515487 /ORGANISM="Stephanopyxis turris, Strain CCMP 815" /LENGTH=143 /DNA_ID=CAMNT_0040650027 /DNA_START=225 /DNA_END=656 /DNA_ORIENTATION=+